MIVFEETVSYLLAKVTTAFRTALEKHMAAIGLHGGQTFVLLELWTENGLRQIDLARRLNIAPPTVNKIVKGLTEINLVTRKKSDGDAKSMRVYLTPQGKFIRAEVERSWVDLEAECLSDLNETERLVLMNVLKKLRNTYTGQKPSEEE